MQLFFRNVAVYNYTKPLFTIIDSLEFDPHRDSVGDLMQQCDVGVEVNGRPHQLITVTRSAPQTEVIPVQTGVRVSAKQNINSKNKFFY